tara:strand:+ start:458 stop:1057 length:600 start_codon:yes stop_codon:yes gene_type:complete
MTKYTTQQVQAGIKFLSNANVTFEVEHDGDERQVHLHIHTPQGTRFWTSGDSIWSDKGVKKGVLIEGIGMCATYTDYEKDNYWSGGLAGNINYDGSGKNGTWYDGSDDENNALINKIKNKEDSDGMIYTDYGFIENAFKYMEEHCDFDSKLLREKFLDFDYSEQGMQDDGNVNLDVDLDGDFWIHCNDELVKFTATKVA